MNIFNQHLILKSFAVIVTSLLLLVLTYYLAGLFGYTPHVILAYFSGGIISAWSVSSIYDRIVLKKLDTRLYRVVSKQGREIVRLRKQVEELEELIGTSRNTYFGERKK